MSLVLASPPRAWVCKFRRLSSWGRIPPRRLLTTTRPRHRPREAPIPHPSISHASHRELQLGYPREREAVRPIAGPVRSQPVRPSFPPFPLSGTFPCGNVHGNRRSTTTRRALRRKVSSGKARPAQGKARALPRQGHLRACCPHTCQGVTVLAVGNFASAATPGCLSSRASGVEGVASLDT